jgi:hypothetical protein
MKIQIENYRGWDILFDTEKESFYVVSNQFDRDETKKSFASAKKYIDDFIKENLKFEPFWIEKPATMWSKAMKVKVIGIRKDKRFVYETKEGVAQLSEYDEKDYFLFNEDNISVYRQMDELKLKKEEIDNQYKELEKKVIKEGLKPLKERYSV